MFPSSALQGTLSEGDRDPVIHEPEKIEIYIMHGTHAGKLNVCIDHLPVPTAEGHRYGNCLLCTPKLGENDVNCALGRA